MPYCIVYEKKNTEIILGKLILQRKKPKNKIKWQWEIGLGTDFSLSVICLLSNLFHVLLPLSN